MRQQAVCKIATFMTTTVIRFVCAALQHLHRMATCPYAGCGDGEFVSQFDREKLRSCVWLEHAA